MKVLLEPGWHIYWQNPGDSGSAPSVKWTLPAGITAGPVQWPVPSRFEVDGGVNYGYERQVILPVALSGAAQAATGQPIQAQVRWVVCRDICVAGRADLEIAAGALGEPADAVSGWQRELAAARARVPQLLPRGWSASSRISPTSVTVELATGRRDQPVAFFPMDPAQVDHAAAARISPTSSGATIELKRSDLMTETPRVFRGVVVLGDGKGYVVEAPFRQGDSRLPVS